MGLRSVPGLWELPRTMRPLQADVDLGVKKKGKKQEKKAAGSLTLLNPSVVVKSLLKLTDQKP